MWIYYSLFFAVWTSISMLIAKKIIVNISPTLYLLIASIFTLPLLFVLYFYSGIPAYSVDFFKIIFVCAILDVIAGILFYKSIKISEISLISPISSFNPIFTLIFAWILLDEKPTPIKLLGIIIIVIGAYILNLKDIKQGFLMPFINLFSNPGVLLFLIVNIIWGLTPVFQKSAILETSPSSPISVSFFESLLFIFFLSPILFKYKNKFKKYSSSNLKWLIIIGLMAPLAQVSAQIAFSMTNVAYAAAIFKLSTLFSVIIGAVFLKEKRIQERFIGAAVMVLGTILIAL